MSDTPKLVRVEWTDAFAGAGWTKVFLPPTTVLTVGWLAHEDVEYIVVSNSWDPDGGEFNCSMSIPRGMIETMETLNG